MKTRYLLGFLATALVLTSCSSSIKFGGNAGDYDDVYYNPETKIDVVKKTDSIDVRRAVLGEEAQMEAYKVQAQELLDSNEAVDTVIYESDMFNNPYDNVLVDNYQDSYERRLKGYSNPWYGVSNNSFAQYSDNWWYASAYDPAFYNIVVMGNDIWVEPNYISASFGYRNVYHNSYFYGGWGNYGFYNNWYSPFNNYYGFGLYNNYWGHHGYHNGYHNGYYDGYHNNYWGNNGYNNYNSSSSNRVYGKSNSTYKGTYSGKQGSSSNYSQSRSAVTGKSYINTRSNTRSNTGTSVTNTQGNTRVGTSSSYTRSKYSAPVSNKSSRSYTPVYTRPRSNSSYNVSRTNNTAIPQRSRSYNTNTNNNSNSNTSNRYNNSNSTTRSSNNTTTTKSTNNNSGSSTTNTTNSSNTRSTRKK